MNGTRKPPSKADTDMWTSNMKSAHGNLPDSPSQHACMTPAPAQHWEDGFSSQLNRSRAAGPWPGA